MTKRPCLPHLVLLATTLSACGPTTYLLRASSVDPSAAGTVSVSQGDNGNTNLKVRVDFLAPPNRIDQADTTYLVWIVPLAGDTRPQSLGAIRVDNNERGELSTVTVLSRFRLFVTPEPTPMAGAPTGPHVLEVFVDHVR